MVAILVAVASAAYLYLMPAEAQASEYYSEGRSVVMIFRDGMGYIGQNPNAPEIVGESIDSMNLLSPLARPRLNEGRCVAYQHFTFAILNNMRLADTFQCNGVSFRVETCIPTGSTCETFEISAQCANFSDGRCHSRSFLDGRAADYTFSYSLSRGLLSVDFAPGASGASGAVRLAGQRGLELQ